MKHYMNLHSNPFKLIKEGRKTIELRLNDEKRQKISKGDIIEFTNIKTLEKLNVVVLDKIIFESPLRNYINITIKFLLGI